MVTGKARVICVVEWDWGLGEAPGSQVLEDLRVAFSKLVVDFQFPRLTEFANQWVK